MTWRLWLLPAGSCVALLLTLAPPVAAQERFQGALSDGARFSGPDVAPWHEKNSQPRVKDRLLLDAKNHFRWLRDNSLPLPSPPDAFVEFYGGDRLPGRVVSFRHGGESPYERLPPHLIVEHRREQNWPGTPRESVRVSTRWLRRVVWQRRSDERYAPGTLFTRDGRQLRFRSLRFQSDGVRLLLEEGTSDVPLGQIAELHMPRLDPWNAYYEQLALLSPDGAGRLQRLDAANGLKATGSMERFLADAFTTREPRNWHHMVQPAWSLDPIWMRFHTIQLRRSSLPWHVPLSDVELVDEAEPASDGGHWAWRVDRNVQGGLLRCGNEAFGWGLGTHAPQRLRIPLPAAARAFRTKLGLDQIAGPGGCARALVFLNDVASPPLYRSDLLIGTNKVTTPPAMTFPPLASAKGAAAPAAQRSLILVSDAAHRERPKGADPLNIRDMVDWLEPELELDAAEVQREVRRRAVTAVPAWEGWTASNAAGKGGAEEAIELFNRWDDTDATPTFRIEAAPRVPGFRLSRTVRVEPSQNWLCMAVSRHPSIAATHIEVRVGGQSLARLEVPARAAGTGDAPPLVAPLRTFRGREVKIELALPAGPQARLDWRGIALLEHRPGLLQLFEEQADFPKQLTTGEGMATLEARDRHAGLVSLKVTPSEKGRDALPGLSAAVRERPRLGEFRYLRLAWKKREGARICLQLAHDGRFGPEKPEAASFRYDAGSGPPSFGAAVRVAGTAPRDWTVITRDLYADFGQFTLTGLSFAAIDGEYALFDHIYLARTLDDLQRIEVTTDDSKGK
jgi:hypothetical protein